MSNQFLTLGEVCQLLRIGLKTGYRYAHKIPGGFKIAGGWRFCSKTLFAALEKQATANEKGGKPDTSDRHRLL